MVPSGKDKKIKIKYLTQTDKRWTRESMALPNDYLWRWGCLVASISNIIQLIKGTAFTPKDFNDILVIHKGYQYLSGKTKNKAYASCIDWDMVKGYFTSLTFTLFISASYYAEKSGSYYIARVTHDITKAGHYINVLGKEKNHFICFDVEDGLTKYYKTNDVTFLHEIKSSN